MLNGRTLVLVLLASAALAVTPQWWDRITSDASLPHGALSLCQTAPDQIMAVELETKSLYLYLADQGVWKRLMQGVGEGASLPAFGTLFGPGCVFYGGAYGKPSSVFSLIQPNSAWNTLLATKSESLGPAEYILMAEAPAVYIDPWYFLLDPGNLFQTYVPGAVISGNEALIDRSPLAQLVTEPGSGHNRWVLFIHNVAGDLMAVTCDYTLALESYRLHMCVPIFQRMLGATYGDLSYFYAPPNRTATACPAIFVYSTKANTWNTLPVNKTLSPTPQECNSETHNVYMFIRQTDPIGPQLICSSRLDSTSPPKHYYYHTTSQAFLEVPPTPVLTPPTREGGLLACATGPTGVWLFYTGGSRFGEVLNDTWAGTMLSGRWSPVYFGPLEPRAFHQGGVWNSTVYALGGFTTGRRAPSTFGALLDYSSGFGDVRGAPDAIRPCPAATPWYELPMTQFSYHWVPFSPPAPADPAWAPPALLWGHAVVISADGIAYITGGVNTTTVWAYRLDLATLTWLAPIRATPPDYVSFKPGLAFHGMDLVPEMRQLCSYGGVIRQGSKYLTPSTLLCLGLDEEAPAWHVVLIQAASQLNFYIERYGLALIYMGDGDMLVYGGQSLVGSTNNMEMVNLYTNMTWTLQLVNAPAPASFFSWTRNGGMLIMLGGASSVEWDPDAVFATGTLANATTAAVLQALPSALTSFSVAAGHYATEGSTSCSPCPAGRYLSFQGQDACRAKCPMGTYSETIGATDPTTCIQCPAGTYSAVEGASSRHQCLLCPPATYSTAPKATSIATCRPCTEGICRAGSTGPAFLLSANGTGVPAGDVLPEQYDEERSRVEKYTYSGLGGGLGLIVVVVGLGLLLWSSSRAKLMSWLRLADVWPGFVARVDELGLPLRTRSPIGGLLGLFMVVIVVGLVGLNLLRVFDRYNVLRETTLLEGIPEDAFRGPGGAGGLDAFVAIASLGHHGPCLANGTADVCDPGIAPTLTTGDPSRISCALRPDGACQINMTIGIQLLANSVITVAAKGSMLYNSGWWWEIAINETMYRHLLTPPGEEAVFHGSVGTAATATMTFLKYTKNNATRWQHWALTALGQPRRGSAVGAADFYSEADKLELALSVVMSPYHQLTRDMAKESPFVVLMSLMGALSGVASCYCVSACPMPDSGAFGGVGVAKKAADTGLELLAALRQAHNKRKSRRSAAGGPGVALVRGLELSARSPTGRAASPQAPPPRLGVGDPVSPNPLMSRRTKVTKKNAKTPVAVDEVPPSNLGDIPQPVFKLVLFHLFDEPQSANASICNLMLVSRRLCQMTSQALELPNLRVAATWITTTPISAFGDPWPAASLTTNPNPFATVPLENDAQLCDEVLHGPLEALRTRRMAHELAIRQFYLELPRVARNFVLKLRAEMADAISKPMEEALRAELVRLSAMTTEGQGFQKQEGLTKQAPAIARSIQRLTDQIAHFREHDRERTDPVLKNVLLLVRRLRCELFSSSAGWQPNCWFHTRVRIDIPWEEVRANMATFVERKRRCRVKADLSPVCLQNGRGSVPLFLDFALSTGDIRLRYGLGQAPGRAPSDSKTDAERPDVESAWKHQLGFAKLDGDRDVRANDAELEDCDGDGGVPEVQYSQYMEDRDLFRRCRGSYDPAQWAHARSLRRLMIMTGLGPMGNVQRFCELLFLLCGADYPSLAAQSVPPAAGSTHLTRSCQLAEKEPCFVMTASGDYMLTVEPETHGLPRRPILVLFASDPEYIRGRPPHPAGRDIPHIGQRGEQLALGWGTGSGGWSKEPGDETHQGPAEEACPGEVDKEVDGGDSKGEEEADWIDTLEGLAQGDGDLGPTQWTTIMSARTHSGAVGEETAE
ncbi:hypothetical protein PAPYR_8489 [Paratrimastix pyriformis]|uniref:Tyrosine-protein kinase ephrin type A/B receptor-like domain-containing protein n=1 Tax=Paratrimastix pyriformis TaxID=342808 RepID=A0ABQ8UAH8_9EUKA|nr:hypothetical protein PAPYR_8489 [Paratrimastix pyriformis]